MMKLGCHDVLAVTAMSRGDIEAVFEGARTFKKDRRGLGEPLQGKSVAMIFEKPSLRTRVSFEVAVHRLGGLAIPLDRRGEKLGERESIRDEAKVLERYVDVIVARVFSHKSLVELAEHARIPVVNALSDWEHPCQALADCFTLLERFGKLDGLRAAYIGDGNNVARSFAAAGALLGMHVTVITPRGHEPGEEVVEFARGVNAKSGGSLVVTNDVAAARGQQVIYTDTWTSMGDESKDGEARRKLFMPYQVNARMMAEAANRAVFLHCLPAHRGLEVTDSVMDAPAPASLVYEQAENRLHVQAAVLAGVVGS
ncbi:MAG TPA: ornithine carbamoyltransferase [Phycisphaerales bacterium]|nr:ornithine carbamoyltransferase [Phycisphaerales bacterium]